MSLRRAGGAGRVSLALVAISVLATTPAPAGMQGRPLADVLAELRADGLPLVYSSAVVRPDLRVLEEPRAEGPRAMLEEMLAPHGLRARDDPSGAILIVRAVIEPVRGSPPSSEPVLVEEIVVTPGHHEIVPHDPTATRTLSGADVTLAPTLGSDAGRSLGLLPGIASTDTSAAFYPRGAASSAVSTILDGLELYGLFHLEQFQRPFTVVDGRIVDAVDFTGGGFTADRGDRNGGFVEMSTTAAVEDTATEVEVGTLNSRLAYQGKSPLGPLLVSARHWYPQATTDTIAFGSDGLRPSMSDLYLKTGLMATEKTLLTAHALLARDRANLEDPEAAEDLQATSAAGSAWLRLFRSFAAVTTETVVSAGSLRGERAGVADPDDGPLTFDDARRVRFAGVRSDVNWRRDGGDLLRGGLELRFLDAELRYVSGPPGQPALAETARAGASYAAYASWRRTFPGGLTGEAGVRWDRQSYVGERQWSPRLNLLWQPGGRDALRLGLGSYAQSQRIHELRIEDGETDYRPAELARQLDLTYTHRFRGEWSVRLDGYEHRLSRVLPRYENLFKPVELFPEAEPDRVLVAPERAHLRGLEISAGGNPRAALGWSASYTWSQAMDEADGVEVPRSWDQTHAGKFLLSYRWRSGWFAAVNGIVHTGWPTTPVVAQVVLDEEGAATVEEVPGPRNAARLPTYARLDLRAGRSFRLGRGDLRVELSVLNATDRANACCLDEATVTETTYDSWLGITPALQILWRF